MNASAKSKLNYKLQYKRNWKISQKSPDFHLNGTLHFFLPTRLSNNVNANPTNKKNLSFTCILGKCTAYATVYFAFSLVLCAWTSDPC